MQFICKMLHILMALLLQGVYLESTKCPESCTCVQTLISTNLNTVTFKDFDESNFESNKSDLSSFVDTKYKFYTEFVNGTSHVYRFKKCKKNNVRDRFLHTFSRRSINVSNLRPKRTVTSLTFDIDGNLTQKSLDQNKIKSVVTEPSGEKNVFTYQIKCSELNDLKLVWIQDLPTPVTELYIQKTYFDSFKSFQQILKESSLGLNQLTVLSVSDSIINQSLDKRYITKTKTTNKDENFETKKHSDFLPFALLQNPKLRPKSEISPGRWKNLQILNLTNSTIVYLPQDIFVSFTKLKLLNLSNNFLEYIENETFSPLVDLLYLDIHNNRLQALNKIIFKNLTRLLYLDISQNLISNIEPSTFQYLLSLNVLILASNPLSEKQEAAVLLGAGKRLQIVDISKTGLKQIPGTLERSVRVLNLMGNLLLSIRCGDLDSYSLLAYLNLKSNKISYIEDDALGRLEFLKNLQISENNLFQVPKILSNNLEILNLSYNNIQNITNLDFLNLSLLKELFLNYNQITSIEENAFNTLVHLKVLDLSRNPIFVLPQINGQIKLTDLDFSHFTNIPSSYSTRYRQFPVQAPQKMKHLNLESSPVLTKIFLQDTKTLKSFESLEFLNLRFTNLTTIRKDIFSILPKLKVLKVEGNPWHCGKEILTLSNWLRSHENNDNIEDEDEVNTAHCLTPLQLYKINLITLEEENFEESQQRSESRLINTTKPSDLPILNIKNLPGNQFMDTSGSSGKFPLVKEENVIQFNKTSANVTFLLNNNGTETSNSASSSKNSLERAKPSNNASANVYLLPSKRIVQNNSNQTTNLLKDSNLFFNTTQESWRDSSSNLVAKRKHLTNLKSRQVSLTVKKAEAVHAKDVLTIKKEYKSHLSFLVVSSIGFVVVATLTFTSLYFTRARRDQSYQRQNQDIEVSSISGLGNELW